MAAIQATNAPKRHVLGDLVVKHYTVSGNNGDTLLTQQLGIIHVDATPTTAIAVGVTVSGSTLTFVTAGAFAADVAVYSREG